MTHRETKATAIPDAVKRAVWERDGQLCIFCGRRGFPNAHIVRRSQGGLGIEENIVTACVLCHRAMDEGRERIKYQRHAETYMKARYPGWDRKKLTYTKYYQELR